jgi:hypothetical protein
MNKQRFASCILGVAIFLVLQGCAGVSVAARLVDVAVVNRQSGERLPAYRHDGKFYIAGSPGDAYSIELRNRIGERVLAVVSVDGVNVLSGETAALLQSGYVLGGGQSYAISGWRKSLDDIAKFVFTALPDSYAARTGRPANVGVVGVAVYRERLVAPRAPVLPYSFPGEARKESSARDETPALRQGLDAAAPPALAGEVSATPHAGTADRAENAQSRAVAPTQVESKAMKLGTGHGEREYAPTRYTDFVRHSDTPDEIITLYYDSRANLIARGIIPSARPLEPSAFPGGGHFVPDPRG